MPDQRISRRATSPNRPPQEDPVSTGTTYKQCSCRDAATKRPLGRQCPRLGRGSGGTPDPGSGSSQREPPPRADGPRRPPLRKGGYGSKADADAQLDLARQLLAIAPPDDPNA